MVPVVSLV